MLEIFKIKSRDNGDCIGSVIYREGTLLVDCSTCSGPCSLSEIRCFKGLSGRIVPGFSGEIILSRIEQRGYSGPIVEVLDSYTEILSLFKGSGTEARTDILKIIKRSEECFKEDPSQFIKMSKMYKKELARSKAGDDLIPHFDDIIERCDILMRKLNMTAEGQSILIPK